MKVSKTILESLADMGEVASEGDLRRIVANSMLAVVRKEMSATDLEAIAKGLDAISNSLNAEVKVIRTKIDLGALGADIGKITHLGNLLIGNDKEAA